VPHAQRRRVIEDERFDEINAIRRERIFPDELAESGAGIVMTMRGSMTRDLDRARCLNGAAAVWSMWPGYLDGPSGQRLRTWFADHDIPLTTIHASGHAAVSDLQALASAVNADRVVPIHTEAPERYDALFSNVETHEDGVWWQV
jgi:ribonuclease J